MSPQCSPGIIWISNKHNNLTSGNLSLSEGREATTSLYADYIKQNKFPLVVFMWVCSERNGMGWIALIHFLPWFYREAKFATLECVSLAWGRDRRLSKFFFSPHPLNCLKQFDRGPIPGKRSITREIHSMLWTRYGRQGGTWQSLSVKTPCVPLLLRGPANICLPHICSFLIFL